MADVSTEEFEGRKNVCDERFKRDKELLERLTKNQEMATSTLTTVSQILTQQEVKLSDHEVRLRFQEAKKGQWMDKFVNILLGALVGGLVGFILYSVGLGG